MRKTQRHGLNDWDKQKEILKTVEEREYKIRCWAVNVCPWCGYNLANIEAPSSHHVSMACDRKSCEGYHKLITNSRDK